MRLLKILIKSVDNLSEWTGGIVSWLVVLLTFVTFYDVVARYLLKSGSVGIQEMEWHLFALIFLLSAGWTLKHKAHVRVDIFYAKLSRKGKAIVDIGGALFLLLPFSILIIYTSLDFVVNSWSVREGSGDPGGLPARYLIKAMIPVGFALLALQGVSELLRNISILVEGDDISGKEATKS